jgi:tetratricopeptide (TPR) repeat protein
MFNFAKNSSTLAMLMAAFILGACASKSKEIENKEAVIYFGSGTQSLMNAQYTDALTNLLKANAIEPNNPIILTNLGMAYYFKEEKETAVKYLEKSIKLDPDNSDAKLNLASIYYNDGDIDRAEKLYKLVLKDLTYDKQARTHYNLGMLELQKRSNAVAAENYFKKAIKEDDNYCSAYFQLALIQFNRRQFNTALKNFKESTMGTCYESPAGHYYQALSMVELKNFLDARLKFDEISTKFPKTVYGVKARTKAIEINDLENRHKASGSQASRTLLDSPEL